MLMNQQDLHALKNFDFLARSFARMYALGQPVDIDAVTGDIRDEHRGNQLQECLVAPLYFWRGKNINALQQKVELLIVR
ncbi:glycogen synthase [Salmonella enterica]|nr:glycogen synthase [Salmonella enterica subsp. enterica]EJW2018215.1 glycogen synthase [Salmonella enterica]EHW9182655.1 glycogen synthase [Salmonella enterica subsp. enterica]EJW2022720.1 glycogen synthase [Salmonella enterica]EJW2098429.1 glycogen synthase [Salmonella enterica]